MSTAAEAGNQQKEPIPKLHVRRMSRTYRMAPMYLECQDAHRSPFLRRLKASYADQEDTFKLGRDRLVRGTIALSPFLGTLAAAVLSFAFALAWAAIFRASKFGPLRQLCLILEFICRGI